MSLICIFKVGIFGEKEPHDNLFVLSLLGSSLGMLCRVLILFLFSRLWVDLACVRDLVLKLRLAMHTRWKT